MNINLIIFLPLLFPTIGLGQTKYKYETYKYKYDILLKDQPSTYTIQTFDTVLNNKSIIDFTILDNHGDTLPLEAIIIVNRKIDTLLRSDFNGFATIKLSPDTFDIYIYGVHTTTLTLNKFVTRANTKISIATSLGKSNPPDDGIGHIYSVRELTEMEVNKIIDDLSNDIDDTELIKNNTCYVVWEI